jgi:hypothetical protein
MQSFLPYFLPTLVLVFYILKLFDCTLPTHHFKLANFQGILKVFLGLKDYKSKPFAFPVLALDG